MEVSEFSSVENRVNVFHFLTLFFGIYQLLLKKSAIIGRAIIETILNWFEEIIL
jgi:hypothetical protein